MDILENYKARASSARQCPYTYAAGEQCAAEFEPVDEKEKWARLCFFRNRHSKGELAVRYNESAVHDADHRQFKKPFKKYKKPLYLKRLHSTSPCEPGFII